MNTWTESALFDLEVDSKDEPTGALTPEYRHQITVDGCLHTIVSMDPEPDASCVKLAEWCHEMRCAP